MTSPEVELLIDEGVRAVAFDEEFRLLKVSEGLEGEVGRSGIVERTLWKFVVSRVRQEFFRRYNLRWLFCMWMVNNKCLSEFEWPCHWILNRDCTGFGANDN